MKTKTTNIIVAFISVLLVSTVFVITAFAASTKPLQVSVSPVERMDLTQTVSATGMVESANSSAVFVSSAGLVDEVYVNVGDTVKTGDNLAKLNTEDLEISVRQQKAAAGQAQAMTQFQVDEARNRYADSLTRQNDIPTDQGFSLTSAYDALETAQRAHRKAKTALDDFVEEDGGSTGSAVTVPGTSYEIVIPELDLGLGMPQADKKALQNAVDEAKIAVDRAKRTIEAVEKSSDSSLDSVKRAIKGAEISNNHSASWIGIEQTQKVINDATITAPQDGVVTAVYAKVGSPGSGIMFVVEDIQNLQIKTTIKDYELDRVELGQEVKLRSDATGEEEYSGSLAMIAPTAVKSPAGTVLMTTSADFSAEVLVSEESDLKIGTSARMDIIVAEKKGVLSVSFDAIKVNEKGEDVVYIAVKDEGGEYTAKEILLKAGVETDFYAEVLNEDIEENTFVIHTSEEIKDGDRIVII